jgi:beta-lactamase regulating signal transducer with metallopeptidase domain
MRGIAGWVNPETMRLMGMALLHFLWQGAAIAAMAFMAMGLVGRASAKYVVAVAMLGLMVTAPAVTFLVLQQRHEPIATAAGGAAGVPSAAPSEIATVPSVTNVTNQIFNLSSPAAEKASSIYLLWFVQAWFLGVVLLSLRPAAGFLLIERLRLKKGTAVTGALRARCLDLQRRLGLNRVVQYCESLQLEAPAVIGWFRPVVLLPVSALTGLSAPQLEAVIAHELAHVKRLDSFVNLFQIAAETLLFYHPAVWWISKRIRAERENCCDDEAISVGGNAVEYARALATMAEWQSAPTLVMAANRSPLAERVARLLGVGRLSSGLRSAGIAGSVLCLCASVFAGNALIGVAQTNRARAEQQPTPVVQPVPEEDPNAVIVVRPAKPLPAPVIAPLVAIGPVASPTPEVAQTTNQSEEEQGHDNNSENSDRRTGERKSGTGKSYIEGLKAEGVKDLSVGELIALKVQNVTPEYVRSIHALGLKPDTGELIAMRVQGVTPELIRELRNTGLALEINQIIAMQVQGVTPEYVKQFHDLFGDTDTNQLIAMKVQGITGDYVREMRAATDLKLSVAEMVAMKIQGVSPDYVREMKALGFHLDGGDIIGMKVQGVTVEYVQAMQSAGLKMDEHAAVGAKVMGLTPEFVAKAREHGFQNLSVDKLMALKHSGVLDQ